MEVDDAVRPTDVVWGREQLQIVRGLDADLDGADPVPLVTSGERDLLRPHLIAAMQATGHTYRIATEWTSIKGVRDSIEAGLGVGMVPTSHVTAKMRPWQGNKSIELPQAAFVLRSRADTDRNELIAALERHLEEILNMAPSPPKPRQRAAYAARRPDHQTVENQ